LIATQDGPQVAVRLRHAITRLNRRLRYESGSELSASAGAALASVRRHGPLSLRELASHEGVRPPSITATVAALEAEGMVRREGHTGDRRVTRVAVTEKGAEVLDRARERKDAFLSSRIHELSPDQLALLEQAVGVLESLLAEDQ
jgi:DNA-binding MarR family transcriptional regulator